MISNLIRYLRGYLLIRIHGDSLERFINLCRFQNIHLWNLLSKNNRYELCISISDFRRIRPIRRKTGVKLQIIERIGFPFFLYRFSNRKLFFAGFTAFCICMYLLCNTVWNIEISGNQYYSSESLTEYLSANKTHIGMAAKDVNCESIVRMLRGHYQDIVWVSVSLEGSQIKIQIKENTQQTVSPSAEASDSSDKQAQDLVAVKSGKITKIITRSGVPLVHEGDEIQSGDILISGYLPIKNDSGEITGYQSQSADADIYAAVTYPYEEILNTVYQAKTYTKNQKYGCYIRIKNTFYALHSVSPAKQQEIHTTEIAPKLLPSLSIPVRFGMQTAKSYEFVSKKYTKEEITRLLSEHFHQFCVDLEKKGVQITENSVKIYLGDSASSAKGIVYANEKTGILKPSQRPEPENERTITP
ncbi:MAG: sporulation protein YqfD [Hespellia sp.]|nr:sporulation protein YqfD [Hespellia sp.]